MPKLTAPYQIASDICFRPLGVKTINRKPRCSGVFKLMVSFSISLSGIYIVEIFYNAMASNANPVGSVCSYRIDNGNQEKR